MSNDKSLSKEDEYFLKMDIKKIKDLRQKLDQSRHEENERQCLESHWMKCPKCGSDLKEMNFNEVMIDRCNNCKGIWLDKGELELLTQGQVKFSRGLLQKIFG